MTGREELADAADYRRLAVVAEREDRLDEAEAWLKKSIATYMRLGFKEEAAADMHLLSDLLQRQGRDDEASKLLQSAFDLYRAAGKESEAANNLKRLAAIASRTGRIEDARASYEEALDIYGQVGDHGSYAETLTRLADLDLRVGRTPEAREALGRALDLYEHAADDPSAAAAVVHRIARVEERDGNSDLAYSLSQDAVHRYRDLRLEAQLARELQYAGSIAMRLGRSDEGEALYLESLETAQVLGLQREGAVASHQLGRVAEGTGRIAEAERWYGRALQTYVALGLDRPAATECRSLGKLSLALGDLSSAERWYLQAVEHADAAGSTDAVVAYKQLAVIADMRGDLEAAERWTREWQVSRDLEMPPLRVGFLATQHDWAFVDETAPHLRRLGVPTAGAQTPDELAGLLSPQDYAVVVASQNAASMPWWEELALQDWVDRLQRRAITPLVVSLDGSVPPGWREREVLMFDSDIVVRLELATRIDFATLDAAQFEDLVYDLLVAQGFTNVERQFTLPAGVAIDFRAEVVTPAPVTGEEKQVWLIETKFYASERPGVQSIDQLSRYVARFGPEARGMLVTNGQLTSAAHRALSSKTRLREIRVVEEPTLKRQLVAHPDIISKFFSPLHSRR